MNLIEHSWLPVRRRSGARLVIRPSDITDAIDSDPIVGFDWPRADFQATAFEFLLGLIAVAAAARDSDGWRDSWHSAPASEVLAAAFQPLAPFFALDGAGVRFMQDFEPLDAEVEPVERLLIETPGGNTLKNNADLMVKRDRISGLGLPAAAMALFTLQSWAPSGGKGNRTGLRGGGPLNTVVLPRRATLWHRLWANLPISAETVDPATLFAWASPTRVSDDKQVVTPTDAPRALVWWGMPRRIRLVFDDAPGICDIMGTSEPRRVIGWQQRPYGANYTTWGGIHPLTPTYRIKPDAELLPVHCQSSGIGYRDWLGVVMASKDGLRMPAPAVREWQRRYRDTGEAEGVGLLCVGFDMDNMKARGFVEAELPLPAFDEDVAERLAALAAALVEASETVAGCVRVALRSAFYSEGAQVKFDDTPLVSAVEMFWAETEAGFHAALAESAGDRTHAEGAEPQRVAWLKHLHDVALAIFDRLAPLPFDDQRLARRRADARRKLLFNLKGYGALGSKLFAALGMPTPPKASKQKSAKEVE